MTNLFIKALKGWACNNKMRFYTIGEWKLRYPIWVSDLRWVWRLWLRRSDAWAVMSFHDFWGWRWCWSWFLRSGWCIWCYLQSTDSSGQKYFEFFKSQQLHDVYSRGLPCFSSWSVQQPWHPTSQDTISQILLWYQYVERFSYLGHLRY